jgi:hypothetical protein
VFIVWNAFIEMFIANPAIGSVISEAQYGGDFFKSGLCFGYYYFVKLGNAKYIIVE